MTDKRKHSSRRLPLLQLVQGLKDQIVEKERELSAKSKALIEERRFIERTIEAMNDAVIVFDHVGLITTLNPAASRLLQTEAEAYLGLPASSLWARPDQQAMFAEGQLEKLLAAPAAMHDLTLLTSTGQEVPVSFRCAPVHGERRAIVGIAHDMRVERRAHEEKLKAVRILAASVAHEIRNPLGAIQNAAALLLRDLELEGDDRTLMEIIQEETERISGIVTQFLKFARPAQARLALTDLRPLIEGILTLIRRDERMTEERRVSFDSSPELALVAIDADQIRQVLWNLLSNALDALGRSGSITVSARAEAEGVVIEIGDDGPGIPGDKLADIFEPFVTTKSRGTGLGLPICKAVMEAHQGSLTIENARDGGAQARLFFPRIEIAEQT